MNKKWKTLIGAILLVVLLGSAYLAYSVLLKQYDQNKETQRGESNLSSAETTEMAGTTNQSSTISSDTSVVQTQKTTAPDFTIYDKDNKPVKLSDFLGKPVVLNFWTSWCPACASEMPNFNEAYEEYKNDVVFLMIDLTDGQRETPKNGLQYLSQKKYSFPFYSDNDQSASNAYNIYYIPDTYLIDSEGNLVKSYEGAIEKTALVDGIKKIKK